MDKAVLATICFAAGAGLGFTVGYYLNKKEQEKVVQHIEPTPTEKPEKAEPEKTQEATFDIKPAKLAKPGENGVNYTEYNKQLKYLQESQAPTDDDPEDEDYDEDDYEDELDESDFEETYEERVEREQQEVLEHAEQYRKEHKGKIELMSEDEWDTDFPETDYEREDLYYFTEDDVLTDEDGNRLDEKEYIGPKVRQVGWMQSINENIYVRNHPKEKEYRIFKEHCSVADWF